MSEEQQISISKELILNLEGYEGPLDVLLILARSQKVDLMKISISALAEQYLLFISEVRKKNLKLAVDYLVMAAWLAYLKSKLVLPQPEGENELTAEEMATRLKFQLRRLEAMRDVAKKIMGRKRLGRDIFSRGMPEGIRLIKSPIYYASLYDLFKAYSLHKARVAFAKMTIKPPALYSMEDALKRLEKMLGLGTPGWERLEKFLPNEFLKGAGIRAGISSTLAASLELARERKIDINQEEIFGPIYITKIAEEV